jgi:hypothetical protein
VRQICHRNRENEEIEKGGNGDIVLSLILHSDCSVLGHLASNIWKTLINALAKKKGRKKGDLRRREILGISVHEPV